MVRFFRVDFFYLQEFTSGAKCAFIIEKFIYVAQKVFPCLLFWDGLVPKQKLDVTFSDKVKMVENVDCNKKKIKRCEAYDIFVQGSCFFLQA